ncbi:MAG: preprotein translocase subunit SecE [Gammaproteobacteria bacterium]
MSSDTEIAGSSLDVVKIIIAVAIIIAAVVLYYTYEEHSQLLRVAGLLFAVGVSAGIFLLTEQGRVFREFFNSAQIEIRKVVWPTRQETVQTTRLVILTVIVAALFFWGLDWILGKFIRLVIGG